MSNVNDRIALFLRQEEEKLDRLRSMIGPLFSLESFEEAVKKYAKACNAQIKRMIDEDVEAQTYRMDEYRQIPSDAAGQASSTSWSLNTPLIPHAVPKASDYVNHYNAHKVPCPYKNCNRLCGNPGSYYRHKKTHEEQGDAIDPKKKDYIIFKEREDSPDGVKVEAEDEPKYQLHFEPNAHEDKRTVSPVAQQKLSSSSAAIEASAGKKRKAPSNVEDVREGGSVSDVSQSDTDKAIPNRGLVSGDGKPKKKTPEKRAQYSVLFKMQAIQKYDEFVAKGVTVELQATVAKHFGINQSSICRWVRQRKEIAAAFQTAEQDRMRVTMTFKRRNAELGGFEGFEDDSQQVAAALGLNPANFSAASLASGSGPGVGTYEPTNMLPSYALAPTGPSSSYSGYYGNAGGSGGSSSVAAGMMPLSGYPSDAYNSYMTQSLMSQYPLAQSQFGSYGYYPSSDSPSAAGTCSALYAPNVASALSLNDSTAAISGEAALASLLPSQQQQQNLQPRSPT